MISSLVSRSHLLFVYLLFFEEHAYVTFDLKDFRFRSGDTREHLQSRSAGIVLVHRHGARRGQFFNRVLVAYSEDAVAAFQVGTRVDHIFLLPVIALASGLVTLVGMFYGAKRRDLVRRVIGYAMLQSVAIAFVLGALFFVLAPWFMNVFTNSVVIADTGVGYLRIGVFAYPFIAVIMLTGRALQGMGQGTPVLMLSFLRIVLISGPLAYVFRVRDGQAGRVGVGRDRDWRGDHRCDRRSFGFGARWRRATPSGFEWELPHYDPETASCPKTQTNLRSARRDVSD